MEESINNSKKELGKLSIRDIFYKYIRFLPLFVLSVVFALVIAFLYLRYSTPIYSVNGTMLINNEQSVSQRNNEIENLIGGNKASNIKNEIEVLKSFPLMLRVVDSLNLQTIYTAKGKIKSVNIYKEEPFLIDFLEIFDSSKSFTLKIKFQNDREFRVNDEKVTYSFGSEFKNDKGIFRLKQNPFPLGRNEYFVTWRPLNVAAGQFLGAIDASLKVVGTGIIRIDILTPSPKMGADIVNKLMDEYAWYNVEQKNKASIQKLEFIDDRLADYRIKIDSAQRILNAFEQRNNLIDSRTQSDVYFENISEADRAVNEQTLKVNVTGILSSYLDKKENRYEKVPTTLNLEDVTLNLLVNEYNKTQIERQQLLDGNVPENNPAVKVASDQIEKLRTSIRENLKNIRTSLASSINTIKGKSQQSKTQLTAMPPKIKEQIQIQRQVEGLLGLFKFLQEEREKQAIIKSANVPNSNIINHAYPPSSPVKPNRRTIQMLAVFLGLGLPAFVIFLRELLNDKVTTRADIEKITSAPILGEIGHSFSDKVLVVNKSTRSMVAEQFRNIRSNLQYVLKKEKSAILFTSSFSGEGKSYVTTNMGAVLALTGKKTIILEFDIRKPKILSGLGLPKGPGITNYLIGKAELKDIIIPVAEQENLYVLGCGPVPPNPAELLLDKRMDDLFAWLKENFDIILVDTAPVGMVSDAITLSKYVDTTLYLVRQGHTFKKQIGLIDEFYKDDKLPKVSIIINDVKVRAGYGYYGYGRYGYGYGYGYGSYYEKEIVPRNFFEKGMARLGIRKFSKNRKRRKITS